MKLIVASNSEAIFQRELHLEAVLKDLKVSFLGLFVNLTKVQLVAGRFDISPCSLVVMYKNTNSENKVAISLDLLCFLLYS